MTLKLIYDALSAICFFSPEIKFNKLQKKHKIINKIINKKKLSQKKKKTKRKKKETESKEHNCKLVFKAHILIFPNTPGKNWCHLRGLRDTIGSNLPTRTNGEAMFLLRSANHDMPHQHMVLGSTEFHRE